MSHIGVEAVENKSETGNGETDSERGGSEPVVVRSEVDLSSLSTEQMRALLGEMLKSRRVPQVVVDEKLTADFERLTVGDPPAAGKIDSTDELLQISQLLADPGGGGPNQSESVFADSVARKGDGAFGVGSRTRGFLWHTSA
jgi:hypothetical protein